MVGILNYSISQQMYLLLLSSGNKRKRKPIYHLKLFCIQSESTEWSWFYLTKVEVDL